MTRKQLIEAAFAGERSLDAQVGDAVKATLAELDNGELRVAEPGAAGWRVNEWAKKAVLLSFKIADNRVLESGPLRFYDKVELKFSGYDQDDFARSKLRVVPGAVARYGAYVAPSVVMMPSFVNIGAYVDSGSMIDTWATVGSCAQIGKNVHLSGGAGIGGVLEPLQAAPTIVEDDCFIGARSEIVEGVIVERGAVISMGVFIGQSTPIYDRSSGKVSYGRVPAGAVVISGSLPAPDGSYSRYAAIIVKQADAQTRAKVSLNELLRPDEL